MSVVTYFVETAGNYLDSAAETGALEIPCHFCKLKKRNDTCEKNLILM